jgi:hypothetical protein
VKGKTTLAVPLSLRTSAPLVCHPRVDDEPSHCRTRSKIQGTLLCPEATEGACPLEPLSVDPGRTSRAVGFLNLLCRRNLFAYPARQESQRPSTEVRPMFRIKFCAGAGIHNLGGLEGAILTRSGGSTVHVPVKDGLVLVGGEVLFPNTIGLSRDCPCRISSSEPEGTPRMPTCPAWSSRIAMGVLMKPLTDSSADRKSRSAPEITSSCCRGEHSFSILCINRVFPQPARDLVS